MNDNDKLKYYLDQIEKSSYLPMDREFFQDCLDEGFPYEMEEDPFIGNYKYFKLLLIPEDHLGLITLKDESIELFNELDIKIKEKYNLNIIDLIDYNKGIIYIIKYQK